MEVDDIVDNEKGPYSFVRIIHEPILIFNKTYKFAAYKRSSQHYQTTQNQASDLQPDLEDLPEIRERVFSEIFLSRRSEIKLSRRFFLC